MCPVVNRLPYLDSLSFSCRLLISAIALFSGIILIYLGADKKNIKYASYHWNGLQKKLGIFSGIIIFIIGGAMQSSNSLSLLVLYAGESHLGIYHVTVLDANYQGSKSKSVCLTMRSEADGKIYYLTLSDKLFNYKNFSKGDHLTLKGEKNIFGTYVTEYSHS